jgi:hypothetical protein
MSVRKRSELEAIQHLQWLIGKKDVDWRTLDYETTEKFISLVDNEPKAIMHHHLGLVLESVAFNPDSTPKERLESVVELVDNSVSRATSVGAREIFYISSDERTDESAVRQLGFEKVVCYRKRL